MRCQVCKRTFVCKGITKYNSCDGKPNKPLYACVCEVCFSGVKGQCVTTPIVFEKNPKLIGGYKVVQT